ncbi:MAG: hypothetical protein V8Q54_00240 [Alistipes senegalensis]
MWRLISDDRRRSSSHSGTVIIIRSRFSRTAYSALSCQAMRSASATNRFAALEWIS